MSASRRQFTRVALLGASLLLVAAGCSTEKPLPRPDGESADDQTQRRVGSLLAEFEHQPGEARPEVSLHAQFLDARGVRVEKAFQALEAWSSDPQLDSDACSMHDPQTPPAQQAVDSDLELDLLSVGPITVEGPARRMQLEERRLPDVTDAFSGVVYGMGRTSAPAEGREITYRPTGTYTFRAPGDRSTGGFEVQLRAPRRVQIEAVSGRSGDGARDVRLRRGRDLRIRWNGAPSATDSDLFFDIVAGYGPDRPRLKCRLEDDGRFTLPGEVLTQLGGDVSSLRLTLRRVRSKDVDIPKLDRAEFYLSATDRVRLQLD